MKFTCTKENLSAALSLTSGLATKNINLPILNNILIKVDDQKTVISATNLELAVMVNLRSKTEKPGSFTVPARTLADFVALLPEEKIEIELQGNELRVACGKSATKIKGSPADEFPVIPSANEGAGFLLDAAELRRAIEQVNQAAARNDIRPELAGVLFNFSENKELTLAATDSYRLAEKKIKVQQGDKPFRVIVPGRATQEMARILSVSAEMEAEKSARLLLSDNQIAVHYDSVQLVSRLVEGQYPDYVQIIPKDFKTTVDFKTSQMAKEIKAASLFSTTGVNGVEFEIDPSAGAVRVASTSSQTGEYRSEMAAEISGEKNAILLNYRYTLDGLNSLSGENGALKMINGASPCLFSSKDDPTFLYIVMPIRQ